MRIIPQLERYPALVRWVQTWPGKLFGLLTFAGLLWVLKQPWWSEITAVVALMTLFPARRRIVLTISGLYWLVAHPVRPVSWAIELVARSEGLQGAFSVPLLQSVSQLVALGLCVAITMVVFHRPARAQRPLLVLLLSYLLLLVFLDQGPLTGMARVVLWAVTASFGGYLWYLGYTFLDRGARERDPVPLQVGAWFPFWVGAVRTTTPFPKGAAYLRKIEARTPEELAVTQLKAIKLLAWVFVLNVVWVAFMEVVHGSTGSSSSALLHRVLAASGLSLPVQLGLPTFDVAFQRSVAGQPFPWFLNWASLFSQFVLDILSLSIWGGVVVACVRMAGFRALRNTYRPFESRTITDFWNRYYYYFKELLVELFFFPTFTRYFKRRPRLRIVAATMAAACFGNILYHFLRDLRYVLDMGLWRAVAGLRVYAIYAFVLGAGISLSQLRRRPPVSGRHWLWTRAFPGAGVVVFYSVLRVFNDEGRTHGIAEHAAFLLHLLPLGR